MDGAFPSPSFAGCTKFSQFVIRLHEPQLISDHPEWGWDLYTVRGGIGSGDHRARLWIVGVVEACQVLMIRAWGHIFTG